MSRHAIGKKLDEVQSKVRRYNDLCRRAIILGEEGSLSQESYDVALCAIKEALKQCTSLNTSVESNAKPNDSAIDGICGIEVSQCGMTSDDKIFGLKVSTASKTPRRVGTGKVVARHGKGKVPQPEGMRVGTQDQFPQMQVCSETRPPMLMQLHNVVPPQLHNMVPSMFQNVSPAQFHNGLFDTCAGESSPSVTWNFSSSF
ncbi:protein FAR1-RELATED SEQUENCE 4 [Rosa chinensis]|nr:protein FAR1-RELATED SEQUENCE 4 [Rosa chinensis]